MGNSGNPDLRERKILNGTRFFLWDSAQQLD
jgi:hypothetical protein